MSRQSRQSRQSHVPTSLPALATLFAVCNLHLHLPLLFHLTSPRCCCRRQRRRCVILSRLILSRFCPVSSPNLINRQPTGWGGGGASPMSLEPLQLASESSESPSISSRQLILTRPLLPPTLATNLLSRQPAVHCIVHCALCIHTRTRPTKSRCVRALGIATPARRYGGRVVLRASCCCCHV